MSQIYYPATETCPAIGVRVIVVWAGRELSAARTRDKNSGAVRWVTTEHGQLVTLPPRGLESRWGEEPEGWRPEQPETWRAPLPEPLTSCAPRMADARPGRARSGGRYAAMSAQAAQSDATRREIEAELGAVDEARASERQWWLGELLSYSPAGEISVREAEGRVARAILTDGIKGKHGGPAGMGETSSALSGFVHETLLSSDADGMLERFEPTPRDLADYTTAFAWFTALNPPELWHHSRKAWTLSQAQCVLVWRMIMPPLSWRSIAKNAGGSHVGARQIYGAALAGVTRAANGQAVLQHVKVKDRMAALRAANRRAKVGHDG